MKCWKARASWQRNIAPRESFVPSGTNCSGISATDTAAVLCVQPLVWFATRLLVEGRSRRRHAQAQERYLQQSKAPGSQLGKCFRCKRIRKERRSARRVSDDLIPGQGMVHIPVLTRNFGKHCFSASYYPRTSLRCLSPGPLFAYWLHQRGCLPILQVETAASPLFNTEAGHPSHGHRARPASKSPAPATLLSDTSIL